MNRNGANVSLRLQRQYQSGVVICGVDHGLCVLIKHHYSGSSFRKLYTRNIYSIFPVSMESDVYKQ